MVQFFFSVGVMFLRVGFCFVLLFGSTILTLRVFGVTEVGGCPPLCFFSLSFSEEQSAA